MAVVTVSKNIAESSVVSLTAGTAHADFPLARVYNRNIVDLFKATAAETTEIHLDQATVLNSNGGFETGDFTGWLTQSAVISPTQKRSGTYSAKLPGTGSFIWGPEVDLPGIDATKSYYITGWLFIENLVPTTTYDWKYFIYDSVGASLGSGILQRLTADSGWLFVSQTIGPAGAGEDIDWPVGAYEIKIRGEVSGSGADIYLDDVSFHLKTDLDPIQACVVASGHNLSGQVTDIQYSADDINWSDAVTQFTADSGHIIRSFTVPLTKRYWRLKITSPSSAVEIPEVFFAPLYTWETYPAYPLSDLQQGFNIQTLTASSGENHYLQRGPSRRTRKYSLKNINTTQRASLIALWTDWAGYKPFFISDHEAVLFYAEIIGTLNLRAKIYGRWDADIELREVLGI